MPQAEEVDWTFPVLVEDVVMMGRYGHMGWLRRPTARDRALVDAALARVSMTAFRHRQIGELSGGQKKRVFLARALAQEGQVILLDEPFTGVDVTTEEAIVELLAELRDEGRVMLISTHNLGSVPEFCDHAILINRRVLCAGPTAEVFTQANLEAAFGGKLRHFVLGGPALHATTRTSAAVTVLSDDERPFVIYAEAGAAAPKDVRMNACYHATAVRADRQRAGPRHDRAARALRLRLHGQRHLGAGLVGCVCGFLSAFLMLKGWA